MPSKKPLNRCAHIHIYNRKMDPHLTSKEHIFICNGLHQNHISGVTYFELIEPGNPGKRPAHADVPQCKHPEMPTKHGSTQYGTGKIYLITKHKQFKVIFDNSQPSMERKINWGSPTKPCKAEWTQACEQIDNYMNIYWWLGTVVFFAVVYVSS